MDCISSGPEGIVKYLPIIIAVLFFASGYLAAYLRQEKKINGTNPQRRKCRVCGLVSNEIDLGKHQNRTNHRGYYVVH